MRVALATTVLAVSAIAACFPAPALASSGPSAAQVRRAVGRAESSRSLWTTINICNSRAYPDSLGVRGQMPALGFAAVLSMRIQIDYYSAPQKRFVPIQSSTATRQISLGRWSSNLQQAGGVFPFKPHAGLLRATVQFTWMRSGKVIGQTVRQTTAGHKDADFASPPHYSAAQCQIP